MCQPIVSPHSKLAALLIQKDQAGVAAHDLSGGLMRMTTSPRTKRKGIARFCVCKRQREEAMSEREMEQNTGASPRPKHES